MLVQHLVVETDVLTAVGGWDPVFRSRVHTELFLRLNPACSILGVATVTYRRRRHDGAQVTKDPDRRARGMGQLEDKHRTVFRPHPGRHADMLFHQAMHLWRGRAPPVGPGDVGPVGAGPPAFGHA